RRDDRGGGEFPIRGVLWRYPGKRLRGERRQWGAALEGRHRPASAFENHGRHPVLQRTLVRAGRVVGGTGIVERELSVLHLPRHGRRARRGHGATVLEDIDDR